MTQVIEGEREAGRQGGRERGREGGRERGREGEKEAGRESTHTYICIHTLSHTLSLSHTLISIVLTQVMAPKA